MCRCLGRHSASVQRTSRAAGAARQDRQGERNLRFCYGLPYSPADQRRAGVRIPTLTCNDVVGARGFEPLTSSVSRKRSPPELSARTGAGRGTGPRRGPESNRCAGLCRPLPNHSATPPNEQPGVTGPESVYLCTASVPPAGSHLALAPVPSDPQVHVARPTPLPWTGLNDARLRIRGARRQRAHDLPLRGVHAVMCRVCDWSADPRMGRPAADRSKNVGLRRRLGDHDPSEGPAASEGRDRPATA